MITFDEVKDAIKAELTDESYSENFAFIQPVKLMVISFVTVLVLEISAALDNMEYFQCGYDIFIADTAEIVCALSLVVGIAVCLFRRYKLIPACLYLIEVFGANLMMKLALIIPFNGGDSGRLAISMIVGTVFAFIVSGIIDTAGNYLIRRGLDDNGIKR